MEYRLKDIGKIVTGKTPSTKEKDYFSTQKDKYMFLTPRDMNIDSKYIRQTERYLTDNVSQNFNKIILNKDSVCISCIGSDMGKVFLIDKEAITNQQINSITDIKEVCNPEYLYYYFKDKKKFLKSIAGGSTMPILKKSDFENIIIKLPERKVQDRIIKILGSLDQKIELNNQINDNLSKIEECYFKKLFKDNSNYEIVKLHELCSISAGGDAPKEKSNIKSKKYNIPIISNSIDNNGIYGYTDKSKINTKSVTISARGTIGFKVLRNYAYYPIVRLISLVPKTNIVSAEYIFYILDDISINSTGTTQQQLTVPMVKDLQIKIFNKELIEKFTMFSIKLNNKMEKNKIENQNLEQLRNTLLPKLMNGEIDLDKIKI